MPMKPRSFTGSSMPSSGSLKLPFGIVTLPFSSIVPSRLAPLAIVSSGRSARPPIWILLLSNSILNGSSAAADEGKAETARQAPKTAASSSRTRIGRNDFVSVTGKTLPS